MDRLPQVLLFAHAGRLANELELARVIRRRRYPLRIIRDLPELLRRTQVDGGRLVILIADLLSTLTDGEDIGGYEWFLREYATLRSRRDASLIVILPPRPEGPGCMIGYGDLATAYVRVPVEPAELLSVLESISQERVAEERAVSPMGPG